MIITRFVVAVVAGYLFGSIPFGLIVGKLARGVDVREQGSGKTGATNVMRAAGTRFGALTMVLDVVKALGAVLLAKAIVGEGVLLLGSLSLDWQVAQVMTGLSVLVGHNWPVFAKFKGGRGVTVFFGTMFAIYPPAALLGVEVWAAVALGSKRMSLGSILGVAATCCLMIPLCSAYSLPLIYLLYGLVGAVLVIWRHWDNVKRLSRGTERQLF
ncbi:MAG: glycerol-3-phosphate 1-O-acyltransferase PlsY [Dehalococcoidia bacterium]|nr:glycerol-3-phosphate 1-O-acyltransferase PlsY [Dehalococcoidia bacterium]